MQEKNHTLITARVLLIASIKIVLEKLTSAYQKKEIQSKLILKTKLHNLRYEDSADLQKNLTDIKKMF